MTKPTILYLILALITSRTLSLNNGEGATPPLGWNSWNAFHCDINETIMMDIADALVSTGLAALGYIHLNQDDCWSLGRAPNGTILPDPTTYPQGMAYLANYSHSRGLLFGIYSDAGLETCQGRPGSLFHEETDAETFAEWGVDYLKYDNCYSGYILPEDRYVRMRDALNKTGKPIFYSICDWGFFDPWTWGNATGNSWRVAMDIEDQWSAVIRILDVQAKITSYSGHTGWNDPDMLEVGNGGMTTVEYTSHFSLWAFMKAPLIIGCDIRNMSNETATILMNSEVIAINQDPLGVSVARVYKDENSGAQIWAGPLTDGWAVILFNAGDNTLNITATWDQIGVTGSVVVRDLWAHENLGTFSGSFSAEVVSHGVSALKMTSASQMNKIDA